MRERSSSVGSNQTEKHPRDLLLRRTFESAMSIYREHVLQKFYILSPPPPLPPSPPHMHTFFV